jgi:hypothetical protein
MSSKGQKGQRSRGGQGKGGKSAKSKTGFFGRGARENRIEFRTDADIAADNEDFHGHEDAAEEDLDEDEELSASAARHDGDGALERKDFACKLWMWEFGQNDPKRYREH